MSFIPRTPQAGPPGPHPVGAGGAGVRLAAAGVPQGGHQLRLRDGAAGRGGRPDGVARRRPRGGRAELGLCGALDEPATRQRDGECLTRAYSSLCTPP